MVSVRVLPACIAILLAGCVENGGNYGVLLVAHNDSGREVRFYFDATFSTPTSQVDYVNHSRDIGFHRDDEFTHSLNPGHGGAFAGFNPACEPGAELVLRAGLENGTLVGLRDEYGQAGCGPRTCTLDLLPDRVLLSCHRRSAQAIE